MKEGIKIQECLDDAIYHLEKAIGLDPVYRQKAKADTDFDNIRDEARFKKLIEGY